jgi:hypothetical protein
LVTLINFSAFAAIFCAAQFFANLAFFQAESHFTRAIAGRQIFHKPLAFHVFTRGSGLARSLNWDDVKIAAAIAQLKEDRRGWSQSPQK